MPKREVLEVFPILIVAIRYILDNLRVFLMASLVPMIFLTFLKYSESQWFLEIQRAADGAMTGQAAFYIAIWPLVISVGYIVFFSMLAVAWHRLTILGITSLPNPWGIYFGKRETRFLGWSCLFGLAMMVGYVPFPFFLLFALGDFKESGLGQLLVKAYHFLPLILYVAVIARYGMVLPATAIGKRPTLKYSIGLTQGHFRKLFLILSIPPLLSQLVWQLFCGVTNIPRWGSVSIVVGASLMLIGVIQVVALSICFQRLREADLTDNGRSTFVSG